MNLGQSRSAMYEYSACAMPLFDRLLQSFGKKRPRIERKVPPKTQPKLKLDWHIALWSELGKARTALQTTEMYDLLPRRCSDTREKRQRIRMILLSWQRAGWIRRSGLERQYRYVRVK